MKAKVVFSCLAFIICLKTVILETVDLSPNQSLRREKRFDLGAVIAGLRTGVKFVDTVNQIFGLEDTTFGRVVNSLAQFDAPESSKMLKRFEDMMAKEEDKMTEPQNKRAHTMMDALKGNMETTTMSGATLLMGSFVTTTSVATAATYFMIYLKGDY